NSGTVITGVSAWNSASDNTGTVRVFWKRAAGDSSQVTPNAVEGSTASANTIVWAPANLTSAIRLYETSDLNNPSGLVLGATSTTAFLSSPQNIDLVLATIPGASSPPFVSLQAADITGGVGAGGKKTDLVTTGHHPGGFAMDIETAPDITGLFISGEDRFIDFPLRNFGDSSVFFVVKTADNPPHYARIEIIPQPQSSTTPGYLWGDSPTNKRFADLNVTYQHTASWGYVGRPGLANRATVATPRVGVGQLIK
ncbi:MAG: hypothetical protein ACHQM6_05830, partial [Candidatus Kapaibacterium sp.]